MTIRVLANDRLRLSITDTCNFRCSYCTNEGQLHNTGKYINLDLVKKLVKIINDEGIYVRKLNITGGEPLLHPDLVSIVRLGSLISKSVTLNTNGVLLTPRKIDELHEAGLTNIKYGVDSIVQRYTKPSYKKTNSDSKKILENIKYSTQLMPRSSMNVVLTDFNNQELDGLIEFIIKNRIDWVEFLELINFDFRGLSIMPEPGQKIQLILKRYISLFQEISYNPRLAKFICLTKDGLTIQFAEDFCSRRVCQNLWTRINADGNLLPCIKGRSGIKIDFSKSLTEQIAVNNNLMCNGPIEHIPRDYLGNLLPKGEVGQYIKPLDVSSLANINAKLDP